jgi:hypothetical protein
VREAGDLGERDPGGAPGFVGVEGPPAGTCRAPEVNRHRRAGRPWQRLERGQCAGGAHGLPAGLLGGLAGRGRLGVLTGLDESSRKLPALALDQVPVGAQQEHLIARIDDERDRRAGQDHPMVVESVPGRSSDVVDLDAE